MVQCTANLLFHLPISVCLDETYQGKIIVQTAICDVFKRNDSCVSEVNFEKTLYKHATMISNDFDFLSPKYTLISFLSISNAYF